MNFYVLFLRKVYKLFVISPIMDKNINVHTIHPVEALYILSLDFSERISHENAAVAVLSDLIAKE